MRKINVLVRTERTLPGCPVLHRVADSTPAVQKEQMENQITALREVLRSTKGHRSSAFPPGRVFRSLATTRSAGAR